MANPIDDDDDEPVAPRRVLDDEREGEFALRTPPAAATVAIAAINSDNSVEMRKLALEEMRFHLEERKELHKMDLELRKVEAEEGEKEYERRRQEKEAAAKEEKSSEHWLKAYWRPAMGWLYMAINAFDFIIAPMMTMAMPIFLKNLGATTVTYTQWQSLTLANGGLIHLAFGAILGVAAWTRGQEKMASKN
jgi:hypothetical protein